MDHADYWTQASGWEYPPGSIMSPYIGSAGHGALHHHRRLPRADRGARPEHPLQPVDRHRRPAARLGGVRPAPPRALVAPRPARRAAHLLRRRVRPVGRRRPEQPHGLARRLRRRSAPTSRRRWRSCRSSGRRGRTSRRCVAARTCRSTTRTRTSSSSRGRPRLATSRSWPSRGSTRRRASPPRSLPRWGFADGTTLHDQMGGPDVSGERGRHHRVARRAERRHPRPLNPCSS